MRSPVENEELFAEIYEETKSAVYRYIASKCRSIEDIDDIFQDAYIEIYKSVGRTKDKIENKEAFAVAVTKRCISKYYSALRKAGLFITSKLSGGGEYVPETDDLNSYVIEDKIVTDSLLEEIYEIISSKPSDVQKIFLMYYKLDMTIVEISCELDIKESTVKKKLYKTLEQIRRLYRGRE